MLQIHIKWHVLYQSPFSDAKAVRYGYTVAHLLGAFLSMGLLSEHWI